MLKVDRLPGDHLSDVRYAVGFPEPAFIIGFRISSLIDLMVYVTLEPKDLRSLKKSQLKELRTLLDRFPHYGFYCQVENATNCRFAEFFGFKPVAKVFDRIHMVRERT
jgi:hypothetical protein